MKVQHGEVSLWETGGSPDLAGREDAKVFKGKWHVSPFLKGNRFREGVPERKGSRCESRRPQRDWHFGDIRVVPAGLEGRLHMRRLETWPESESTGPCVSGRGAGILFQQGWAATT